MSVHLPEETRSLAAAVDRSLRACYALCFGAGPLDPNGLSESQEDRAFVRDRFALPVRLGGGSFRPTVERALFLNNPSNVAPQFLATEQTRGLWPSLDLVFGAGSFNADNAATRWDACLLRLWESHCAGSPVRVGQSPTSTQRRYHRFWPPHAAHQNRPRRQRERLWTQG